MPDRKRSSHGGHPDRRRRNPLQRDILTAILSDEGYETLSAASGEEALRLVKAYEPDLVLTDLKMGRMDGIELLEKIKGLKQPPTVISW